MSLLFRTQTGEESLKESLLSVITASDNATLEVLDEAFCRDAEAFSEAFQVTRPRMLWALQCIQALMDTFPRTAL